MSCETADEWVLVRRVVPRGPLCGMYGDEPITFLVDTSTTLIPIKYMTGFRTPVNGLSHQPINS